ncbi:hypothetical protein D3C73_1044590 [compost metagenome]
MNRPDDVITCFRISGPQCIVGITPRIDHIAVHIHRHAAGHQLLCHLIAGLGEGILGDQLFAEQLAGILQVLNEHRIGKNRFQLAAVRIDFSKIRFVLGKPAVHRIKSPPLCTDLQRNDITVFRLDLLQVGIEIIIGLQLRRAELLIDRAVHDPASVAVRA